MIDLRSDTVTRPTPGMRAAIAAAEVGDDVFGDDPTVNRLQAVLAGRLGFEAGLFFPTGTQSNLAALMTHCARGDEVLVGQEAHTYKYEGGGAAVLGSIQPQPIEHAADGTLPLARLEAAIKPDDPHFPRTRLLALENTLGGRVIGLDYCRDALALARRHDLFTHLDGARLFNAATALGIAPRNVAAGFDTVSVCLSKGLGAPAGTVLLGRRECIDRARRPRKMLGGVMRQAGLLAAAGLYALDHHVERLAEDHANADRLAQGLRKIDALAIDGPHTNMVFVDVPAADCASLAAHLAQAGVLARIGPKTRFVTHLDVDAAGIARVVTAVELFYRRGYR